MNSLSKHISLELNVQDPDNKDYESDLIHVKKNSLKIIECRIEFVKIGRIKTIEEEFSATVKIRSKWYEDEIIEKYDPKIHWDPKIYIENAVVNVNYFQDVSYKTVQIENRTLVTEIRSCKGKNFTKINQNFNYLKIN